VLIAQITDCHVVEPGELVADRVDSAAALQRVVERIEALPTPPDLVVATGDLVNDGRPAQYDRFQEIVGELSCHSCRSRATTTTARAPRPLPRPATRGPDDPIDHVLDLGPAPTGVPRHAGPGSIGGAISPAQVAWLDGVLSELPTARPSSSSTIPRSRPGSASWIARRSPARTSTRRCSRHDARAARVVRAPAPIDRPAVRRHRRLHLAGDVRPSSSSGSPTSRSATPTSHQRSRSIHWTRPHGVRSHLVPVGDIDRWTPVVGPMDV
jgi:hypothetical protein